MAYERELHAKEDHRPVAKRAETSVDYLFLLLILLDLLAHPRAQQPTRTTPMMALTPPLPA